MSKLRTFLVLPILILLQACVYQRADMNVDISVETPHFSSASAPQILFDAGHNNFHDIHTTYEPFAALVGNDGLRLQEHEGAFTSVSLDGTDLLIIANAMAPENDPDGSAFSENEIQVLLEWVRSGGALLLIADHEPFGNAAAPLAKAFGVEMESVWTVDMQRVNPEIGRNTWLEYNRENGGLGSHPILDDDVYAAPIQSILTFTGQSLGHDSTWTSILQLSPAARNYLTREDAKIASELESTYSSVPGQSQLIAKAFGEGRIVIAGEAAMFTAQEVRIFRKVIRAGFNYEGYDNKQLILNTVRWLLAE